MKGNQAMTSLKPCPFCGAQPPEPRREGGGDEQSGYGFRVTVSCPQCCAHITRNSHRDKIGWCDDKGEAEAAVIEAWNRRS